MGKIERSPGQTLYRFLHEQRALGVSPKDYPTSAYYDSYYCLGKGKTPVKTRMYIVKPEKKD